MDRLAQAKAFGRGRNWLEMNLLCSLALYDHEDPATAFHLLADGLAYAHAQSFKRIFIDQGEPMQRLLEEYRGRFPQAAPRSFVSEVLAIFRVIGLAGTKRVHGDSGWDGL
jgi:hypothetical protein